MKTVDKVNVIFFIRLDEEKKPLKTSKYVIKCIEPKLLKTFYKSRFPTKQL